MSFQTVKDLIAGNLKENGFDESETTDFKSAAASEYANTFIIKPLSGVNDEVTSETLSDRFYDIQEWSVQIAFARSDMNEVLNLEDLHRKKDTLIAYLDKPANWSNSVRLVKYISWEIIENPNHYVLDIRLKIIDQYIYA